MFCPRCGSLLKPSKEKKKTLICSCGYKSKSEGMSVRETIESKNKNIDVVDREIETLPKTDAECPKCHHRTAYYWLVQTRSGDEPETKFLKCEKCKHIWRDYN